LGGYPFGWLESWVLVLVSTKSELGLSFLGTGTEVKSRSCSGTKPGPAGSGTGIEKYI
jgi:hypothetical protein